MIFYIAFKLAFVLRYIFENVDWSIFWAAFGAVGSIVVSIIAIALSITSLKQTKNQIEINNKQFLFDRRTGALESCDELFNSFWAFSMQQNRKDNTLELKGDTFSQLTFNDFFGHEIDYFSAQIEEENNKNYLIRNRALYNLIKLGKELNYIFKEEENKELIAFVNLYRSLLQEIFSFVDTDIDVDKPGADIRSKFKASGVKVLYEKIYEQHQKLMILDTLNELKKQTKIDVH